MLLPAKTPSLSHFGSRPAVSHLTPASFQTRTGATALIPDSFLTDVMGEVVDGTTGVQYEIADATVKKRLLEIERNSKLELDDMQRQAVISAIRNGVSILTGGPGTGKTTTINTIIRYFEMEESKMKHILLDTLFESLNLLPYPKFCASLLWHPGQLCGHPLTKSTALQPNPFDILSS